MKRLVKHRSLKNLSSAFMALIGALLLATSCGDEGNDEGPLDNLLRVIQIIPQNGENNVDATGPLQIRMNAPLLTSSVTDRLQVSAATTGAIIQGTPTFTEGDSVINFIPQGTGTWPGSMQIRVTLLAGVQSTTGLTLTSTFTSFFNTGFGNGLGNTSKPGEAPFVQDLSPNDGSDIPTGQYTLNDLAIQVRFSECMPPASVQINTRVELNPVIGSSFSIPFQMVPDPSGFDDRLFFVAFSANVQAFDEVKINIDMESAVDCNNEHGINNGNSSAKYTGNPFGL